MSGKSRRGFASMDPARQRAIASRGGKAAHEKGTAHEWTSDEARDAGRKGGEVVSRDRAHMAAIGREGGEARGRSRARAIASATNAASERYSDRETPVVTSREFGPNTNQPADRERDRPAAPQVRFRLDA
jgi:general stress protein YciG